MIRIIIFIVIIIFVLTYLYLEYDYYLYYCLYYYLLFYQILNQNQFDYFAHLANSSLRIHLKKMHECH